MNWLHTAILLLVAYLAVFLEASFGWIRLLIGTQIHFLPVLMVYTALTGGLGAVALLSIFGALCFDSLSANPIGLTILPLFVTGMMIWQKRAMLLREQVYAQFVLGCAAGAAVPALSVGLLALMGRNPLVGWGSLWQWFATAAAGGLLTPAFFVLFDRIHHALSYQPLTEPGFRPDREIKRGRF